MSDAWPQNSTIAEGAVASEGPEAWANNGRSPSPPRNGESGPRQRDGDKPAENRRSRSPERREAGGGEGERGRDLSTNPGNNLHVSGLSHKVDNRELETIFGKFGKVDRAAIMHDPHTRESRGFGFVTMETAEAAEAAIASLNGTEIMGKAISIEKARRGRARTPTPGRYFGPPKRTERPYDPRPYDSRYARRDDRPPRDFDRRGYGGRDERRYDDRRDDRGRYDDRRFDDRRLDDRRYKAF